MPQRRYYNPHLPQTLVIAQILLYMNAVFGALDVLQVSLADKVHNARSILRDLRTAGVGTAVWGRFGASPTDTIAYYAALAALFRDRLPGQLADELAQIFETIAADSGLPAGPLGEMAAS